MLPFKKQRTSTKNKAWFAPQTVERIVEILKIKNLPLTVFFKTTKAIDNWRFEMDKISESEYRQIAAIKPSTARKQVLELQFHVETGFIKLFFKKQDVKTSFVVDGGSTKCRQGEPIKSNCFAFTINQHIPNTFKQKGITQFSCLYKGTIKKVQADSDTAIVNADAFRVEVIKYDVHGIEFWISDCASNMPAAVKVVRGSGYDSFRSIYGISKLWQHVPDALHIWYDALNNSNKVN